MNQTLHEISKVRSRTTTAAALSGGIGPSNMPFQRTAGAEGSRKFRKRVAAPVAAERQRWAMREQNEDS